MKCRWPAYNILDYNIMVFSIFVREFTPWPNEKNGQKSTIITSNLRHQKQKVNKIDTVNI